MAAAFLAIGPEADATVQYTEVDMTFGTGGVFSLDFDGDGTFDARVFHTFTYSTDVIAFDGYGNRFVGYGSLFIYGSALASGLYVGAGGSAVPNLMNPGTGIFTFATMNYGNNFGPWVPYTPGVDTIDAYLGMEFLAGDGMIHNAWIRCKVTTNTEFTVVGYAWEDAPTTPIVTGDTGPVAPPAAAATALAASDAGDAGDGSDLQLDFLQGDDETTIAEYRAIAVKTSAAGGFDLAAAEALTAGSYVAVPPSGVDPGVDFGGVTDADGDAIVNAVSYTCFVLSMADGTMALLNTLSAPSNEITLQATASATEDVTATDISDNGDGSDMNVAFDMAPDESTVSEYRILVVKADSAMTFDEPAASAVSAGLYAAVSPIGGNISHLLHASSTDTDGDPITEGVPYVVFVLSVADGANAQINALSDPSAEITLGQMSGLAEVPRGAFDVRGEGGTIRIAVDPGLGAGRFDLRAADGRLVRRAEIASGVTTLPAGDLAAGIYLATWRGETARATVRLELLR